MTRGLVFGTDAAHYDTNRPAVPPETADWLVPAGCRLAVDVGAGTGHFTRHLVERAGEVVVVEKDPQMCSWLRARFPGVPVHQSGAEDLPLADGTADGVFTSNAWHWFDPAAAGAEAARCLKPGGVLGISWHVHGPSEMWLDEIQELLLSAHHPDRPIHEVTLPSDLPFADVEKQVVHYEREMTAQQVWGMFSTYAAVMSLSTEDREELMGTLLDHLAGYGEVLPVPFEATMFRTTRL